MGYCVRIAAALLTIILLMMLAQDVAGRHVSGRFLDRRRHQHQQTWATGQQQIGARLPDWYEEWKRRQGKQETVEVAGSSLPDCSHACGSCRPCRLVMVSFVCASLEEAETCPMAYKCMCRSKSYPVP